MVIDHCLLSIRRAFLRLAPPMRRPFMVPSSIRPLEYGFLYLPQLAAFESGGNVVRVWSGLRSCWV